MDGAELAGIVFNMLENVHIYDGIGTPGPLNRFDGVSQSSSMSISDLPPIDAIEAFGEERIQVHRRLDGVEPLRSGFQQQLRKRSRSRSDFDDVFAEERPEDVENPAVVLPGECHRLELAAHVAP